MSRDEQAERPAPAPELRPRHVAIIMDGNGRWAQARGLSRADGHSEGASAVRRVVRAARELELPTLTLFAFSSQNWIRPATEVAHLMALLERYLVEERAELLERGIRLRTIGQLGRLPGRIRLQLAALERESAENTAMTLCLALSYGGREAIVQGAQALARQVADRTLDPADLDADRFAAALPTAGLAPLDLLIRSSGERRISNFLLWELAWAELYFTERLWPDFSRVDLVDAMWDYARRDRRFGGLSARSAEADAGAKPAAPAGPVAAAERTGGGR